MRYLLTIILLTISVNAHAWGLWGNADMGLANTDKGYSAAALAYKARVVADGGTVENLRMIDDLLRDAVKNGYSTEINGAVSPRWGRKLASHSVVKLYALGGAAYDLSSVASNDDLAPAILPNNGMSFLGRGTNSWLRSSGYTLNQPTTIVADAIKTAILSLL